MATAYRRHSTGFAEALTTRLINVPTGAATLIQPTSGAHYMQIFNVGPSSLAWGDSSLGASSGGLLFYSMSEIFNPVQGDFSLYVSADSVQGVIAVNELI